MKQSSKRTIWRLAEASGKQVPVMLGALVLALSVSAFAHTLAPDPVGFCAPPATVSACTTGVGSGGETIPVGTTTFGMEKNGSGTSTDPWYLLVAVPEATAGSASAPTITSSSFTQSGSTVNLGAFGQSASGSIYDLAGLVGDSSMNASNMFCDGKSIPCASSNEITAHGSLPNFFQIFEYTFDPGFGSFVPYTFNAGTAMVGGTFLAASGGSHPFSTPYMTTGLVGGHTVVPEPSAVPFLGAGLLAIAIARKALKARAVRQV